MPITVMRLVTLAGALLALMTMATRAEILVSPTRVVLDGTRQSMEVVVVNRGDEEFAYRVSLENMRMLEDGSIVTAEDVRDGERFAGDIVRFSPRRLILRPDEEQVVRVFARVTGLEEGEYRSHLRLRSAPTSAGRSLETFTNDQGGDIAIELTQIRSITIPVIVRRGALTATAMIDNAELAADANGGTVLKVRLSRTGTQSVYGDLQIYGSGDTDEPMYYARGIALYTPNPMRMITLPLPDAVRSRIAGQAVKINYVSSDPNRPEVLASFEGRL